MRLWISRTTENQGKLLIRHEKINKYINLFFFCQESLFIMFTCCRGFNRLNSFPVFNKNDSTRILHLTKGPEWRCSEGSGGSYALPLNHMLKPLILPVPSPLPTERHQFAFLVEKLLEIIQEYIIRWGSHRILRKTLENTHIGIILTIFLFFNSWDPYTFKIPLAGQQSVLV